jgi:hypothetical protein
VYKETGAATIISLGAGSTEKICHNILGGCIKMCWYGYVDLSHP